MASDLAANHFPGILTMVWVLITHTQTFPTKSHSSRNRTKLTSPLTTMHSLLAQFLNATKMPAQCHLNATSMSPQCHLNTTPMPLQCHPNILHSDHDIISFLCSHLDYTSNFILSRAPWENQQCRHNKIAELQNFKLAVSSEMHCRSWTHLSFFAGFMRLGCCCGLLSWHEDIPISASVSSHRSHKENLRAMDKLWRTAQDPNVCIWD